MLNGQEDLKLDVFSQIAPDESIKEQQCGNLIVPVAFVNVTNRIITIIVLLFPNSDLHLFVLIFDKVKTRPRLTLFSGEPP